MNFRTFHLVEEGLISQENIGEGRMLPALVVDFGANQDIIDLIKVHTSIIAGDASTVWVMDFFNRKELILKISFSNPMVVEFGIRFNIEKECLLIDGILQSQGLLLRSGKKGEKISEIQTDTILIEVPETGMKSEWDDLFFKIITKKCRKKGIPKKESKTIAFDQIKSIREIWKFRRNTKQK